MARDIVWLQYEAKSSAMICELCVKNKKTNTNQPLAFVQVLDEFTYKLSCRAIKEHKNYFELVVSQFTHVICNFQTKLFECTYFEYCYSV